MSLDTKSRVHDGDEPLVLIAGLAQADTLAMLVVGKLRLPVAAQPQGLFEGVDCRLRKGGFDRNAHTLLALRHCANLLPRSPARNVPAGRPGPSRSGSMSRLSILSAASIPFRASTSTLRAGFGRR